MGPRAWDCTCGCLRRSRGSVLQSSPHTCSQLPVPVPLRIHPCDAASVTSFIHSFIRGRWGRGAGPGFKRYVRACWRVRRGHVQRQRARVICHRTAGSLLSHPGWLGFCRGRALTDGAPVTHCWGPPNRQAGAYGLKPGFWMAGARGRVLARAFACWACCAPPFEGSAWEHVAAAFCPGYGFLGGACDGNVASAASGGLDVCGCGVWTACLYLAGDLWSRQPCDAASVTFFIHSFIPVPSS